MAGWWRRTFLRDTEERAIPAQWGELVMVLDLGGGGIGGGGSVVVRGMGKWRGGGGGPSSGPQKSRPSNTSGPQSVGLAGDDVGRWWL